MSSGNLFGGNQKLSGLSPLFPLNRLASFTVLEVLAPASHFSTSAHARGADLACKLVRKSARGESHEAPSVFSIQWIPTLYTNGIPCTRQQTSFSTFGRGNQLYDGEISCGCDQTGHLIPVDTRPLETCRLPNGLGREVGTCLHYDERLRFFPAPAPATTFY